MTVFVDTSALYALLDRDDLNHGRAAHCLLGMGDVALATHNYVVVEASALVQRRLGLRAVNALFDDLLAPVRIHWVTEELHRTAASCLVSAQRRDVSLVDWVSFEVMRRNQVDTAFAFDSDFADQGFELLPAD